MTNYDPEHSLLRPGRLGRLMARLSPAERAWVDAQTRRLVEKFVDEKLATLKRPSAPRTEPASTSLAEETETDRSFKHQEGEASDCEPSQPVKRA